MMKSQTPMKYTIIVFVTMIMLLFSISGCQKSEPVNSGPSDAANTVYLASWRGELGKLDTQTRSFEPLYNELYVEIIIGKTDVNTILVLAHPGGSTNPPAGLPNLYQVNLDDLTSTHLAESVNHAYLSPDKKQLAYISFPDNHLQIMDIETQTSTSIVKSVGYFQKSNIWSPDGTRLLVSQPNANWILDLTSRYRHTLSEEVTFLDWLDNSHLLVLWREKEADLPRVASYEIQTGRVSPLFMDSTSPYFNAQCTGNNILAFKVYDTGSPVQWDVFVSSKQDPAEQRKLFSIPPKPAQDLGYVPVFFYNCYPVSYSKVFYRVITSENYEPMFTGIVDINSGILLELDKEITSVIQ
ncbi:MAG TPA: hypothetical protein DCD98_01560 [Syntrophomonas sp.]|jgi:hypothetical protein|nr:hypothetical protein [Bacillota bacterium]HAA08434.1 hypothetical protein [Syntrophomonas sp.]HQA50452.1 hypothetical protein [Syntrophomonadaceae bacterium]HQD90158.1 hypothetical protein [Syntrophomonadaceae bacterium]